MRQKQLPEKRHKVKIESILSTQTQFIDLHQGHQIISDLTVQKVSQIQSPK